MKKIISLFVMLLMLSQNASADSKISALSTVSPAAGDFIPVVNGGATKKTTITSIAAAMKISWSPFGGGGAPGSLRFGDGALANDVNPTTSMNVAIGNLALGSATTGTDNTAVGYNALGNMTDSTWNTAVGWQALSGGLTTTAVKNTVVGANSGISMSSGTLNTAVGYHTQVFGTSGSTNTSVGVDALYDNITGSGNTALGYGTMTAGTSPSANVAVGNTALYNSNATGNTGVGYRAGYNISTGTLNTFVGYDAGQSSSSGLVGSGAFGEDAQVSCNGCIVLGKTAITAVGIGLVAPSARLHIKAGSATAGTAPIKLTAGTVLATPENGTFEYDGTNLFFTTGGVRTTLV